MPRRHSAREARRNEEIKVFRVKYLPFRRIQQRSRRRLDIKEQLAMFEQMRHNLQKTNKNKVVRAAVHMGQMPPWRDISHKMEAVLNVTLCYRKETKNFIAPNMHLGQGNQKNSVPVKEYMSPEADSILLYFGILLQIFFPLDVFQIY